MGINNLIDKCIPIIRGGCAMGFMDKLKGILGDAKEKGEQLVDKAEDLAEVAKDKAEEAIDKAQDKFEEVKDTLEDKFEDIKDDAEAMKEKQRKRWKSLRTR